MPRLIHATSGRFKLPLHARCFATTFFNDSSHQLAHSRRSFVHDVALARQWLALMLRFTTASATLSSAIAARDEAAFARVVRTYIELLLLYLPPIALDAYATSLLKVGWRETLVDELLGAYFAGAAFFTLKARSDAARPLLLGPPALLSA